MQCPPHELGDVVITRGAKFRLSREFRKEAFAHKSYRCAEFNIPQGRLAAASNLLKANASKLAEPAFGPPHVGYAWPVAGLVPGLRSSPTSWRSMRRQHRRRALCSTARSRPCATAAMR
jgi:hypothetical protein